MLIYVSTPQHIQAGLGHTKEEVWGIVKEGTRLTVGKLVAASHSGGMLGLPTTCPIFGDKLPYKSVTAVCTAEEAPWVIHWLEYVNGGGCVNQARALPDGRVALRSDYMCEG